MSENNKTLFPAFEKFARDEKLLSKVKGALVPKIHRIIGQGKTRAVGLDLPPAPLERKMELCNLGIPHDWNPPASVEQEILQVCSEVETEIAELKAEDGIRRLAQQVLRALPVQGGFKDNYYFAGRLVLKPDSSGLNWAWSVTPYYPLISKIPPDKDYLEKAFEASEKLIEEVLMPPEEFDQRLRLAWLMAKHFSGREGVLTVDVARMFKVAGQKDPFWNIPKKGNFNDLPEAAFVVNLMNWKRYRGETKSRFEFVPATIHQTHGRSAQVFHMPFNEEGTQCRPVIYMRPTE